MLTIFGYGAPATDIEAVELMRQGWGANPTFEIAQVGIVDIRPEEDLRPTFGAHGYLTLLGEAANR
jgi:hypothetical protein